MVPTGIGERLQIARTARGLTLDDIEAATRIKRRYLEAIEREAWDELPGPAYARGFLAAYARQLGLPPDEIVGQYRSEGTPSSAGPRPVEVRITPGAPQSRLKRIVTAVAIIFVAGTIVLTYVLVGQLRQFAATRPRPGVTANPSTAAPPPPRAPRVVAPTAPAPGAPATAPAPGVGASPPPAAPPAATPPGAIVLSAQATDRSWVRVVSDGSVVFEGFVSAGEHQTWQGHQVSIRIGNASALDLSVNGRAIGRLGNPGDVVERTFGAPPAGAPGAPAPQPAAPPTSPAPAPPPPARPAPPAPAPPSTSAPVPPGPSTGPPPPSPPANVHQ